LNVNIEQCCFCRRERVAFSLLRVCSREVLLLSLAFVCFEQRFILLRRGCVAKRASSPADAKTTSFRACGTSCFHLCSISRLRFVPGFLFVSKQRLGARCQIPALALSNCLSFVFFSSTDIGILSHPVPDGLRLVCTRTYYIGGCKALLS
jgi:hypothetical protein